MVVPSIRVHLVHITHSTGPARLVNVNHVLLVTTAQTAASIRTQVISVPQATTVRLAPSLTNSSLVRQEPTLQLPTRQLSKHANPVWRLCIVLAAQR